MLLNPTIEEARAQIVRSILSDDYGTSFTVTAVKKNSFKCKSESGHSNAKIGVGDVVMCTKNEFTSSEDFQREEFFLGLCGKSFRAETVGEPTELSVSILFADTDATSSMISKGWYLATITPLLSAIRVVDRLLNLDESLVQNSLAKIIVNGSVVNSRQADIQVLRDLAEKHGSSLNESQKIAIIDGLYSSIPRNRPLSLIQGPPGTGTLQLFLTCL